jgi:hypothetical protein
MTLLPRPVHHHRQDGSEDCGKACAQIVVGYVREGTGDTSVLVQQSALTPSTPIPGWATDPQSLADYINAHQGVSSLNWIVVNYPGVGDTEEAKRASAFASLLTRVKHTIDQGAPAVVSRSAADHWVVIYGYGDTDTPGYTEVRVADPLSGGGITLGVFPHAFGDGCPTPPVPPSHCCFQPEDYRTLAPADDAWIVDVDPFRNRAVAIVPQDSAFPRTAPPAAPTNLRITDAEPLAVPFGQAPPLRLKRPRFPDPRQIERSIDIATLRSTWRSTLLTAAPYTGSQRIEALLATSEPERAVIREVVYHHSPQDSYFLVAIPSTTRTGLMAMFRRDGTLAQVVTVFGAALESFLQADDRQLICVDRYGEIEPFVRERDAEGRSVLRRLTDGLILLEKG